MHLQQQTPGARVSSKALEAGDSLRDVRRVFEAQAMAIIGLASQLDESFERAVDQILSARGRVVFCGMGKSGLIARKLSATFSSTGTPSFFLHPADALHGDLGMVTSEDVAILLSYSGETEEVTKVMPLLRRLGVPTIAIVGNSESTLGRESNVTLMSRVEGEVCPNGLAPTTSTLAAMALGDALAVTLMRERSFSPRDFAQRHPGGSLGRALLSRVRDDMRSDNLPTVHPDTSATECMITMNAGRMGLALATVNGRVTGIVTDGDLRRAMSAGKALSDMKVMDIMTPNPRTIRDNAMVADAEERMRREKVKALVVVDDACELVGVFEIFR